MPSDLSSEEAGADRELRQALAPGLAAMMPAFVDYRFDRNQIRNCNFPVFYGLSNRVSIIFLQGHASADLMMRLLRPGAN